jgi:hypothetical protein
VFSDVFDKTAANSSPQRTDDENQRSQLFTGTSCISAHFIAGGQLQETPLKQGRNSCATRLAHFPPAGWYAQESPYFKAFISSKHADGKHAQSHEPKQKAPSGRR